MNQITKGNVTLGTPILNEMKDERGKMKFLSHFNFLRSHRGWRDGCIHTLMGAASGGKTTMVKSIMVDLLENARDKGNIGVFLSEQDLGSFLLDMNTTGYRNQDQLDRMHVRSQQDDYVYDATDTPEKLLKYLEVFIKENDLKFLVMDNLTTIAAYEGANVQKQSWIAFQVKKLAKKFNIPFLVVAHVGSGITEGANHLIDQNHIRGSRVWTNISEYFYIMQRFDIGETIFQTLRICKHRNHEVATKMYQFKYHSLTRMYVQDIALSFVKFKEIYKQRNRL